MDFDKIKKVAKDTFKIVSSKTGESNTPPRPRVEPEDDFDDFTMDDDFLGQTRKFDMKDALNRVKKNTMSIKSSVAELIDDEEVEKEPVKATTPPASYQNSLDTRMVNASLVEISDEIKSLRSSNDNLEAHIVVIERKLSEISNAVSGVNKISDSIFDLKNSQINTRNSISELEVAFRKMKKKMVSGITVISIITAIVAILEIINLIS